MSKKIADAKGKEESLSKIKSLLSQVPSGQGQTQNEMAQADEIQAKAFHFDPDNYTTEEVQQTLWQILGWRDRIMRKVSTIMEKIPGLEDLMDQLTDALNVCKSFESTWRLMTHVSPRHLYYNRAICQGWFDTRKCASTDDLNS